MGANPPHSQLVLLHAHKKNKRYIKSNTIVSFIPHDITTVTLNSQCYKKPSCICYICYSCICYSFGKIKFHMVLFLGLALYYYMTKLCTWNMSFFIEHTTELSQLEV